jgi:hypothetical protein
VLAAMQPLLPDLRVETLGDHVRHGLWWGAFVVAAVLAVRHERRRAAPGAPRHEDADRRPASAQPSAR